MQLDRRMGITIHYRFMARSRDAVSKLLAEVKVIAEKLGMKVLEHRDLELVLHPHPDCETLALEFEQWKAVKQREGWNYCKEVMQDYEKVLHDDDYVCGSFTKTQYAGYKTHVLVAELLRKVAGSCTLAYVSDEADYYETRDAEKTMQEFDESSEAISKIAGMLKEAFGKDRVYASIDHVEGA